MLKMIDSQTIGEYYARIKKIVNQIKLYGENIIDKRVVNKLFITVIEKYDSIR